MENIHFSFQSKKTFTPYGAVLLKYIAIAHEILPHFLGLDNQLFNGKRYTLSH